MRSVSLRRALVASLLGVLLVLGLASPAAAHAEMLTSTPSDGSLLKAAPEEITLTFSEGVSIRPDGVRVLAADGKRVDRGQAEADGSTVNAPLKGTIADGSYQVAWRALSADGHPVHGAFTFSVGKRTNLDASLAGRAFGGGSDRPYEIAAGVLRSLSYVGALAAAGMVVMGALLHREGEPSPVGRLAGVMAGLGMVAVLLQVPIQATLATGEGMGAIAQAGGFAIAIRDGVGLATLVTLLGLIAIVITVGLPFTGIPRWVALVGGVLAPIGFAFTGHTRTMTPAVVGYLSDVVHLLAGAAWFGGLLALLHVIRLRRGHDDEHGAAEAVASFSGWAGLILVGVIGAGTALGWLSVGGWKALTTTTYGQVLLLKVGVVALVAAGAGWNRFKLVPLARRAESDADPSIPLWTTLTRIVRAEAVGIVVVLALTGALVNITPAKVAVEHGPVTVSAPLGDGEVEATIDPASPGRNTVHVYLYDQQGRPDDTYKTIAMAFTLPALDLGPLERTPARSGPGHFQLVSTPLTPGGRWTLTVTVRPDRFTEQKAELDFTLR